MFCKQSKHLHVSPDLELPPKYEIENFDINISEIKSVNNDLNNFHPISVKVANLDEKLTAAEQLIKQSESERIIAHNATRSVMETFKKHVADTVASVKQDIGDAYNGIVTQVILPIMLPPIMIFSFVAIGWIIIKKIMKKSSQDSRNSSDFIRFTHANSREDAVELPVTTA